MKIAVITLFPALIEEFGQHGIVRRAIEGAKLELSVWNPRDFSVDRHRNVDDRPYGGGPGMVMRPEPVQGALRAARQAMTGQARVVYLTPQGRRLDHDGALALAQHEALIFLAGRYEGIDERVVATEVDEEWSIGDYVLSGGEAAAMVMIDAITRQLPDVLGHAESAGQDSFAAGLLDWPHYTRPELWAGLPVPPVLLSGDHEAIRRWRLKQALGRTWIRRPDLLERLQLTPEQRALLEEFRREHKESGVGQ